MEFREAVEAHDVDRMIALLDDEVVFRSPVVYQPYRGRDEVAVLIRAAARLFEGHHYVRAIGADAASDHAPVFKARIGDREIEGCDFLHVNDAEKIDEFSIMVRPLSGAMALAEGMKTELEPAESEAGGR
jgi:hypothetical protein